MGDFLWKIYEVMNQIKGFTVGTNLQSNKMLFEFDGKRYVAEFREVENPSVDIKDDMRRINYL